MRANGKSFHSFLQATAVLDYSSRLPSVISRWCPRQDHDQGVARGLQRDCPRTEAEPHHWYRQRELQGQGSRPVRISTIPRRIRTRQNIIHTSHTHAHTRTLVSFRLVCAVFLQGGKTILDRFLQTMSQLGPSPLCVSYRTSTPNDSQHSLFRSILRKFLAWHHHNLAEGVGPSSSTCTPVSLLSSARAGVQSLELTPVRRSKRTQRRRRDCRQGTSRISQILHWRDRAVQQTPSLSGKPALHGRKGDTHGWW